MNPYDSSALKLVRAAIELGERVPLRVIGQSMWPLLGLGDVVWVERISGQALERGMIIVAWQDESWLTHRVIAVLDTEIRTKGDNTRLPDAPLPPDAILGRVVAVERGGRRIEFGSRGWTLANRLAGLLLYWEAALLGWGLHVANGRSSYENLTFFLLTPLRLLAQLVMYAAVFVQRMRT